MKLGNIVPLGGQGAGATIGVQDLWESFAGDFRANPTAGIQVGDEFYLRGEETDFVGGVNVRFDTNASFAQGLLVEWRNAGRQLANITHLGCLWLCYGATGDQTGLNTPLQILSGTGATEWGYDFVWGSPNTATPFMQVREGNHIRFAKPSRPSGLNPFCFMLHMSPTRVDIAYMPNGLGNVQQSNQRVRMEQPDTESFELATGNDSTSAGLGDSRRGFLTCKSRKYAVDQMPGLLALRDKNGVDWFLWVDTTGVMRISSTDPRGNDTGGTPV